MRKHKFFVSLGHLSINETTVLVVKQWVSLFLLFIAYLGISTVGCWQRHPVRGDARQFGEELSGQGAGATVEEIVSKLVGRAARVSHVERQEASLVSGKGC